MNVKNKILSIITATVFLIAGAINAQNQTMFSDFEFYVNQNHPWVMLDDGSGIWHGVKNGFRKIDYDGNIIEEQDFEHRNVADMVIDSDGTLWLASSVLMSYDGIDLEVYEHDEISQIYDLTIDGNDNIWCLNSPHLVTMFDGDKFTNIDHSNFNYGELLAIEFNETNDEIWVSTFNEIFVYNGSSWVLKHSTTGMGFYQYIKHVNGSMLVAGQEGILKFTGNNIETIDGFGAARRFDVDSEGNIFITKDVFEENGLIKYDGNSTTIYNTSNSDIPHDFTLTVLCDKYDKVWVMCTKGLYRFDNNNWDSFNNDNSVLGTEMYFFDIDSYNQVWVGNNSGVSMLFNNTWTNYSLDETKLTDNNLTSLVVDNENNVWISADGLQGGGGVSKFNGTEWVNYGESFFDTRSIVDLAYNASNNLLYVSTALGSIYTFDGSDWEQVYHENDVYFIKLAPTANGNLWMTYQTFTSSSKGVAKFDGNNLVSYTNQVGGLLENYSSINYITEDKSGNIWIASDVGIAIYKGDTWIKYTTENSPLVNNSVTSINIVDNEVWIVNNEYHSNPPKSNIFRYKDENWEPFNKDNGFHFGFYTTIKKDNVGNYWFGGEGLLKASRSDGTSIIPELHYSNHVYPNPAKDYISIKALGNNLEDTQVKIISVNGVLVHELSYTGDKINIDFLDSGIYFVEIQEGVKTVTSKLIVN